MRLRVSCLGTEGNQSCLPGACTVQVPACVQTPEQLAEHFLRCIAGPEASCVAPGPSAQEPCPGQADASTHSEGARPCDASEDWDNPTDKLVQDFADRDPEVSAALAALMCARRTVQRLKMQRVEETRTGLSHCGSETVGAVSGEVPGESHQSCAPLPPSASGMTPQPAPSAEAGRAGDTACSEPRVLRRDGELVLRWAVLDGLHSDGAGSAPGSDAGAAEEAAPKPTARAAGRSGAAARGRGFMTPALRMSLFGRSEAAEGADPATPAPEEASGGRKRRRPSDDDVDETPSERPRSEVGLQLVGEVAPANSRWSYPLRDDRLRCYAASLPGAVDRVVAARLLETARQEVEWQQPEGRFGKIPRKTAWMVKAPCSCKYRYGGLEVKPSPFSAWVQEAMAICMPHCGLSNPECWPNSCNLNLYDDGADSVAWHADDEPVFCGKKADCCIISLSLGASRRFDIRPVNGSADMCTLELASGDLCTMEGMTQKHYLHRVPKEKGAGVGPRVNLTWRWIKAHRCGCDLATEGSTADEERPATERRVKQRTTPKELPADESGAAARPKSTSALKKISKQLVKLLEQQGKASSDGFVSMDAILASPALCQLQGSTEDIDTIIKADTTGRFQSEQRGGIQFLKDRRGRCAWDQDSQPTTVRRLLATDLDLPDVCTHGTQRERWPRVLQRGFSVGGTGYVHFAVGAATEQTDRATGMRPGASSAAVHLDLKRALADGMEVQLAADGTVLAGGFDKVVAPVYFLKAVDLESGQVLWDKRAEEETAEVGETAHTPCA
mmetsp:Transcript_51270/g.146395  ORF Transcript_51270/g.146395 Transcript_51270/m.146395 type:complete len:786 (+) Transcript_51270:68-2425(+)